MSKTYSELLKDPRWQRKRLEILSRSDFSCEECGSSTNTLNVHHKRYRQGAKPWEYQGHELAALCEPCHEGRHSTEDKIESLLKALTSAELVSAHRYIQSLIASRGAAKEAAELAESQKVVVSAEVRETARARRRALLRQPMSADQQREYDELCVSIANMVVER